MRNRVSIWLLLGGGAFVLLAIALVAVMLTFSADDATDLAFSDRIQVVDVDGELVESRAILDQLKRYEDSNSVKAILLNIDSPGGGVAVSQEIYTEIRRLRDKKRQNRCRLSLVDGCVGCLLCRLRGQQNCC